MTTSMKSTFIWFWNRGDSRELLLVRGIKEIRLEIQKKVRKTVRKIPNKTDSAAITNTNRWRETRPANKTGFYFKHRLQPDRFEGHRRAVKSIRAEKSFAKRSKKFIQKPN